MARALGYDLKNQNFLKSSLLIAGTSEQAADKIATFINDISKQEIENFLLSSAKNVKLMEVIPLDKFLKNLQSKGVRGTLPRPGLSVTAPVATDGKRSEPPISFP